MKVFITLTLFYSFATFAKTYSWQTGSPTSSRCEIKGQYYKCGEITGYMGTVAQRVQCDRAKGTCSAFVEGLTVNGTLSSETNYNHEKTMGASENSKKDTINLGNVNNLKQ